MKKYAFIFSLFPLFGTAQLQHFDSVQIKTIGAAWSGPEKFASLQEKLVEGQPCYYLTYWNYVDRRDIKLIKFTGNVAVLDEVYKSLLDAFSKPEGSKIFFKLGDQVLSTEVKKGLLNKFIAISADEGEFQLNERQLSKLFGKYR